jgi:hypothetical protein
MPFGSAAAAPLLWSAEMISFPETAAAPPAPAAAHAPWSLSDILWDPITCTALPALVPAPMGAVLLPQAMPARPTPGPTPSRPAGAEVRCQVVACEAPLREAGRYYVRNRLCQAHLRAPELKLPSGAVARFCQARSTHPAHVLLACPADATSPGR